MYNVYSQMVYALKGSDVTDVMVNGRAIVRDRRMLTQDRGDDAQGGRVSGASEEIARDEVTASRSAVAGKLP